MHRRTFSDYGPWELEYPVMMIWFRIGKLEVELPKWLVIDDSQGVNVAAVSSVAVVNVARLSQFLWTWSFNRAITMRISVSFPCHLELNFPFISASLGGCLSLKLSISLRCCCCMLWRSTHLVAENGLGSSKLSGVTRYIKSMAKRSHLTEL